MEELIKEGKTVEAAINAGLEELGLTETQVQIKVMQEPVKGIFGLTRVAKVKLIFSKDKLSFNSTSSDPGNQNTELNSEEFQKVVIEASDILKRILVLMGIPGQVNTRNEEGTLILQINSEAEGLLIGRHGETLSALQYLVNRMIKRPKEESTRIMLDVGSYRDRHKLILQKMALRAASKVLETQRPEELESMSAFDRRIVHLTLKDNPQIITFSQGEGSFRRVIVAPQKSEIPHNDLDKA